MRSPLLRLAHVHRVVTRVGGRACDVFVFDHHRSAFALWCQASQSQGPLTLVSLDRHLDLARPAVPPPESSAPLELLDAYARDRLSPANDDHLLAAMDAGAIGDALVVARSRLPAGVDPAVPHLDPRGGAHRLSVAPNLESLSDDQRALATLGGPVALDVDLDCFTTLSDGHAGEVEVVAWDEDLIDAFLRPPGWEEFWPRILERTRVVTLAREPYHCGGLGRGALLWDRFARVFFGRLLGVPPP